MLMFAMALAGVSAGSGMTEISMHIPLEQAKEIHYVHLGDNSSLPDQATNGQQNSLDHIVHNQERWLAKQNVTLSGN